jgi:hypothetical protein
VESGFALKTSALVKMNKEIYIDKQSTELTEFLCKRLIKGLKFLI